MDKVTLQYWLLNESEFTTLELSVDDYFDPLDEDEQLAIDSVPKFTHPYMYVPEDISKIIFLKIRVEVNGEVRIVKQTFWNNGQCHALETFDFRKESQVPEDRLLILSVRVPGEEETREIIRLEEDNDRLFPVFHGHITSHDNAEDELLMVDTSYFVKLLKSEHGLGQDSLFFQKRKE